MHKTNLFTKFHDDWANNVTSRETNVLTKFHENLANNVTSRVFTCFHNIHIEKNAPPTGVHISIKPIFDFHDDWAKIVTSRVFTRKTALPTGGHVFQRTGTTFELNQHIIKANILTKFHENWAKIVTSRVFTCFHFIHIEKNAPHTDAYVFSPIWTVFEFVRDINKPMKTAPPTGGHTNILTNDLVFNPARPNFELDGDFIGTKLLTKFHEDRK
ncbi:hypothetical protein DPMN_055529 [Dreissena polymorpha]|uniref:Uncharacterized protein n=1 Tax=Dreissena polymorpha TaxID=45954 RepID=A0A9D4CQ54_DREPO|nr:hypothetical protein DPMN_055529 [Dreissena polymorpha]